METYKTIAQSLARRIEEKLQMSEILYNAWKQKEECSAQRALILAPSMIELFLRLKEYGIDPIKKEQSFWDSGIKHVDKIHDMLPEIIKKWRKIMKKKGLPYKIDSKLAQKIKYVKFNPSLFYNPNNIELVECESLREEALVILLKAKSILQDPQKTVSIVSDNIHLVKIILSLSSLLELKIDNYSGLPCREMSQIDFLRLIIDTAIQGFPPAHLIALLRHKIFSFGKQDFNIAELIAELESKYLRGLRKYDNIVDLTESIRENKLKVFLWLLKEEFKNFMCVMAQPSASIHDIFMSLMNLVLRLSDADNNLFYNELIKINFPNDKIAPVAFLQIFNLLFTNEKIKTPIGSTRIKILPYDDIRVHQSDYAILTGMNEETILKNKPYDIRLIQNIYKLLSTINQYSEFAKVEHIFALLVERGNLLITRSSLMNGTPQTPSRLLIKLQLAIHKLQIQNLYNKNLLQEAKNFYTPTKFIQNPPIAPIPNFENRLNKLSVTQVEKLIRDPYSIYVSSILKLKKLDDLDKPLNKAEFGKFIHKVIDKFSKNYVSGKDKLKYFNDIITYGQIEAANIIHFPLVKTIWIAQLKKLASWIINFEIARRKKNKKIKVYSEEKGEMKFALKNGNIFTLLCNADRIEITPDGIKILDFKTGNIPSKKEIFSGISPQLLLEALIMTEKGFNNISGLKRIKALVTEIAYVNLGTNMHFGNVISFKENLSHLITETQSNLKKLVEFYNNATTPFLVSPNPNYKPSFNEYAHIERIEEL